MSTAPTPSPAPKAGGTISQHGPSAAKQPVPMLGEVALRQAIEEVEAEREHGARTAPLELQPEPSLLKALGTAIARWFDTQAQAAHLSGETIQKVDWVRCVPFALLHLSALAVIWVGWSPVALAVCLGMYVLRMFAITGFYHRYFSHKSFKTSRAGQFVFAVLGASATQRGPLWWASHHRMHHKNSDKPEDVHSPKQHGFWWSHMGWITSRSNFPTHHEAVRDLVRFPELRFLDRFDTLVPILAGASMFFLGMLLDAIWPSLGTSAGQMLVWGFFISTLLLLHGTFTINSLSHVFGWRRYETTDTSRNNPLLALITLGEGWHNNHHYYQSSARQGFYWWEFDITYYGLKVLSWFGIVWDLRPVPASVRDARPAAKDVKPGNEAG
jgi:stearoyl-CoA desaturase (Delta-9 desaturase)